ncbi:MAG TPA: nuclear transport factor 2 family protein [Pyrinomonadaceae bacterium]|nr:nuclear transport factor 2 family protein [Pyrinomonadaceae bacterium]
MSPEIVSQAVKAYFAALSTMNIPAILRTFAEDAVTYDPVGTPANNGHKKIEEFFETVTAAFKEVGLTENEIFIAGNGAAVKWTGRGVSKQGRSVKFEGIDTFEINESGKIQTLRAYWNPAEMVAQL